MMLLGAVSIRLRMRMLRPAAQHLHQTISERKVAMALNDQKKRVVAAAAANATAADPNDALALLGDLKTVYRFKDVTQLSVLCREMRKWDEDGVSDPEASDYGEFILKVWE